MSRDHFPAVLFDNFSPFIHFWALAIQSFHFHLLICNFLPALTPCFYFKDTNFNYTNIWHVWWLDKYFLLNFIKRTTRRLCKSIFNRNLARKIFCRHQDLNPRPFNSHLLATTLSLLVASLGDLAPLLSPMRGVREKTIWVVLGSNLVHLIKWVLYLSCHGL